MLRYCFASLSTSQPGARFSGFRRSQHNPGRLPERPKGADCKSAGNAYSGSNPLPATGKKPPLTCETQIRGGLHLPVVRSTCDPARPLRSIFGHVGPESSGVRAQQIRPCWARQRRQAAREVRRPPDPQQRGARQSEPGPAVPAGEARSHSAHVKSHHSGDAYAAPAVATVQTSRASRRSPRRRS